MRFCALSRLGEVEIASHPECPRVVRPRQGPGREPEVRTERRLSLSRADLLVTGAQHGNCAVCTGCTPCKATICDARREPCQLLVREVDLAQGTAAGGWGV